MFGWLFGKPPSYSIYLDLSKREKYSARIVRRDDPGIKLGKPDDVIFMLPVAQRYKEAADALHVIVDKLQDMEIETRHVRVWREQESGGVILWGLVKDVLDED